MLGMAGFTVANRLLTGGDFALGRAVLDSLDLPPTTADTAGLVCALTTTHALAAVLDGRLDDAAAPMDAAAEVAERFGAAGATDPLGFVHVPADVGVCRMWLAVESNEPDRAVGIARNVRPEKSSFPGRQSQYWLYYGQALAQVRGRHDDAVRALRMAEETYPTKVRRDAMVRNTLAVLLRQSRRGSPVYQELRGMARRAGLPV